MRAQHVLGSSEIVSWRISLVCVRRLVALRGEVYYVVFKSTVMISCQELMYYVTLLIRNVHIIPLLQMAIDRVSKRKLR